MFKKVFLVLILTVSALPAFGEYRVYQYYIRSKMLNINPASAQVVTSTLNPANYMAYHGGKLTIDLTLLRSWMCMGNTSHEPVCPMSEAVDPAGALK